MMDDAKSGPIMDNEHVKELLSILRENGSDTGGIVEVIALVAIMEGQLIKAVDELSSMRKELAAMREGRDHPVRTVLEMAARSLEAAIKDTQTRLAGLKELIIAGCKK